MKHHITTKQLNELSKEAVWELRRWQDKTYPRQYLDLQFTHPNQSPKLILPSIGQMIEFLDEKQEPYQLTREFGLSNNWLLIFANSHKKYLSKELCNVLWEVVKDILIAN